MLLELLDLMTGDSLEFSDWKREESELLILFGREGWFSLGLPGYFGDNVAEEQDVVGVAKV